ncbi:hypothetical protein NC651_010826 [Populus alba x Populus x berolinensis]|nr:hypothetical protein NC651_010826 [Populus alba x Populus x berolinensis]
MADNMGLSCGGAQGGELHSCTNGGCYGHLGQLALSGVSLATSNNVTGFSLLVRGGVHLELNVDADTQASP